MSTCCAAVKQAFCLQAIEISDEEVSDGPEVQQQGRKRQRVVSMCQCNTAASCTFAQRVLLLQADDPYNLNCHGDCSEQLFGGKSIADCTLHPCTSLRECVTQAWFCQPCSAEGYCHWICDLCTLQGEPELVCHHAVHVSDAAPDT